jgi:hypothetical protein
MLTYSATMEMLKHFTFTDIPGNESQGVWKQRTMQRLNENMFLIVLVAFLVEETQQYTLLRK